MSTETWGARGGARDRAPWVRRTDVLLAAGVLAALVGATLPLLRVIDSGWWLAAALGLAAAVLATGVLGRGMRLPGVAVAALEGVVWVLLLTVMFGRSSAVLWMVPTPDTFATVPVLVSAGVEEIVLGAAPLEPGVPLTFVLVAAVGLVALAIDHVVLTARMPLLAGVALVAISLIPSIAVPGEIDLVGFVVLSVSVLFLLRIDTRARHREPDAPSVREAGGYATAADEPRRSVGATATALAIGAIAVVAAVVATPLLPTPLARAGSGGLGTGSTIDPTLELGDDLRQPRETQVLTVRSSTSDAPYLRAVTLSDFDGSVWEPDTGRTTPLAVDEESFPAVEVAPGIELEEQRATVEIVDLNSPWLPVPFPATTVTGLDGAWGALAQNRTVLARSGSTQGQGYDVESTVPRPTLEQISGIEAGGQVREESYLLPDDLPAVIEQTAREVTADAQSDFEALQDLQAWFRSSEFEYSLEAPVEEGFDGSGALAVADFLAVRQGYCVHFASAFALMARTLDMPSRIVVGYLPGVSTNESTDGETVYSVSSSQLHSWPEVHFPGVGWVPFEPTNSLGSPTSFSSASAAGAGAPADGAPEDALQPEAGPTASPTAGARPQDDLQAGGGGTTTTGGVGPWPGVGTGMLLLPVLALPGVLREARRRRAVQAAEGGDAGAAWLALQELAIDLGIPVPGAESPRAFGARLTRDHGASENAVGVLVAAIERSSYGAASRFEHGGGLAPALAEARTGLLARVTPWRRILSVAVPRSLVIRPGSAYAHPPQPATAR